MPSSLLRRAPLALPVRQLTKNLPLALRIRELESSAKRWTGSSNRSQRQGGIGRQYEGTGLGLSIYKRLVELMDGTISVKSQWGQGSTFIITLPVSMI